MKRHALREVMAAVLVFAAPLTARADLATWLTGNGNWSDQTKWSSQNFPNNGNGGVNYDVTVTGGTITLDIPITINSYTQNNGVLTATSSSTLTLNQLFSWSGGNVTGAVTIQAGGGITLNGNSKTLGAAGNLGTKLINNGTANFSVGNLFITSSGGANPGSQFLNNGIFNALDDASLVSGLSGGSPPAFTNAATGVFTKTGPGTTTSLGVPFTNAGTINVTTGTLALTADGSSTGTIAVANGAVLQFGGGVQTIGATYTAAGTTLVTGGEAIFNNNVAFTTLSVQNDPNSVFLTANGTNTVSGSFTWTGGQLRGSGTTTILSGATMSLEGGIAVVLGGTGGAHTLINSSASPVRLSGKSLFFNNGAVFDNKGSFEMVGGVNLSNQTGGTFLNEGTLTKSGASTVSAIAAGVTLTNTGTVKVDTGTLILDGGGTQSGAFNVAAGATLQFDSGTYTLTASSTVGGAGTINFTGSTTTIAGAYNAPGVTSIIGGSNTFNTNATFGTLNLQGDPNSVFLTANGTNTVSSSFTWTGGQLRGTGTTTIPSGATMSLEGGQNVVLGGVGGAHTLINSSASPVRLSGKSLFFNNGAVFDNRGTFEIAGNIGLSQQAGGGTFQNEGTVLKTGVGSTSIIDSIVTFSNAGTVSVDSGALSFNSAYTQTAGRLMLNGGSVIANAPLNITGGSIIGHGGITGSVTNNGTIAPGPSAGRIDISSELTLGAGSVLALEIGGLAPGTQSDLLTEGGSIALTLAGKLSLAVIGGFVPDGTQTFTILTSNMALTGQFSNVANGAMLATATGESFQVNYGPNSAFDPDSVVLSNFTIPEPSSAALAAFSGLLLAWRRRRTAPAKQRVTVGQTLTPLHRRAC